MRVPWTARRSNQSILKDISPGCSLERLMLKLKLQYSGHLMRTVDSLEKTLMLGKIDSRTCLFSSGNKLESITFILLQGKKMAAYLLFPGGAMRLSFHLELERLSQDCMMFPDKGVHLLTQTPNSTYLGNNNIQLLDYGWE